MFRRPLGKGGPVWAAPGGDCLKNNSIAVFEKKLKGGPPPLAPFWTNIPPPVSGRTLKAAVGRDTMEEEQTELEK